ncbi:MAG TPA: serine O-acetyltransferase [Jatrophihabitans sp.]|nr:serine O-acetyltransferase [Jatrophihabitans sp.]
MTSALPAVIRADIEATTHANFRIYSNAQFWTRALAKALLAPNVRAVITFRLAHFFATKRLLPVAMWLRGRAVSKSGADIHPLATIGPGLFLPHSSGVVIGPDVVIGARARIYQGVTLGEPVHVGGGRWTAPRVGDDVVIGAHAVVLGAVTIGDGATIGANSVVTADVAPRTVVAGVPARVVRETSADE